MFIQGGCHFQDSLFFYKIFAVFPKYPAPAAKTGHHSTYDDAVEDLDYFGNVRNIPKEKLVLGVPLYGYGFCH